MFYGKRLGKENLYRRIAIRKIARIQSFPDNFKFVYKNANEAYKIIGNATPVQLAYEIAMSIRKIFCIRQFLFQTTFYRYRVKLFLRRIFN